MYQHQNVGPRAYVAVAQLDFVPYGGVFSLHSELFCLYGQPILFSSPLYFSYILSFVSFTKALMKFILSHFCQYFSRSNFDSSIWLLFPHLDVQMLLLHINYHRNYIPRSLGRLRDNHTCRFCNCLSINYTRHSYGRFMC